MSDDSTVPKSMSKPTTCERLYRYNLVLSDQDSAWLDRLAEEIHTSTGAKVSRSEILRASIAGLRELHRLAPECPSRFVPLATCNGSVLGQMIVLAIRFATTLQPAGGTATNSYVRHERKSAGTKTD